MLHRKLCGRNPEPNAMNHASTSDNRQRSKDIKATLCLGKADKIHKNLREKLRLEEKTVKSYRR
jgi:hypothetical protein